MIGLSCTARRVGRGFAATVVVVPLSVAMSVGMLLVAPGAAQAASSFQGSTPSNGAVLTTNSFTVDANVTSGSDATTLTVTGTDAAGTQVCQATRTSDGRASSAQRLAMSFPSSSTCSTNRNARWTATLSGGSTRSFATNAAPATPVSFDAQGSGAREVTFTWTTGKEADLTGYVLYDGETGAVIDGSIDLSNCNGDTCSYGLYYPADKPGTHTYQLAARRAAAGCGSCEGSFVESSRASSSATLVLPPPPPPAPTPSPTPGGGSTTGGTTGGSTGGSTSGGTTTGGSGGGTTTGSTGGTASTTGGDSTVTPATPSLPRLDAAALQRRAFALQFSAFAPSLKIPKLPPLPANFAAPQLAEAPLPDGTFDPKLDYGTRTEVVKETTVLSQFRDVAAVDTDDLAKGLAAGLILLLLAAHVRRFVSVKPDL